MERSAVPHLATNSGGMSGPGIGAIVGQIGGSAALGPLAAASAANQVIGDIFGFEGGPLGILTGTIKKLFSKTPSANLGITGIDSRTAARGDGKLEDNLGGLAGTLSENLQTKAKTLGATVGAFSVSLGQRGDYYRVGSSASFDAGSKYAKGSLYDGPDANKALQVALGDALSDGAIKGLSAAVERALKSSTNLDAALAEALKVQDLQELLGGVTGAVDKAFADFEKQAQERLRIATAYGFDIVKIEELNAKERLKLTNQLLDDQVGSLQRLIDQMTGGSLFEGSAVDHRAALLDQITKAKADTDAGTAGAADKLASLLEQLNSVSRDVYGTTGGFAADRGAILDQARDSIARANQRIADAQTKSDPALAQTNAALDENNDQNARLISGIDRINDQLGSLSIIGGGGASLRLRDIARTSFAVMGKIGTRKADRLTAELLTVLGENAAFALAEEFAGTRLYVPSKRPNDGHLLVRAIGRDAADALVAQFGSATIRMPLMRELRAKRHREKGLSNQRIAVRLGMTETGVSAMFRRMGLTSRGARTGKRTDEQRRAKWAHTVVGRAI